MCHQHILIRKDLCSNSLLPNIYAIGICNSVIKSNNKTNKLFFYYLVQQVQTLTFYLHSLTTGAFQMAVPIKTFNTMLTGVTCNVIQERPICI